MAFKLKGFPKHGTKSGFPKVIKETGYKPEEQDDPTKKFRHDVKTREHDDGKTEEVHTFARGGRYDTEAKVVGKKGDKHFKDKDGDGVPDQKQVGEVEGGRLVTIGKRKDGNEVTYVRDAERIKRFGKNKGKKVSGIFGPREISEDRYERILNRKTRRQERKDAKHAEDPDYKPTPQEKKRRKEANKAEKAKAKAAKKAEKAKAKEAKKTAEYVNKGNKDFERMAKKGEGSYDKETGVYTGPGGKVKYNESGKLVRVK